MNNKGDVLCMKCFGNRGLLKLKLAMRGDAPCCIVTIKCLCCGHEWKFSNELKSGSNWRPDERQRRGIVVESHDYFIREARER